jgi:predicted ABC-type transport system involved in lysophospholipase L1 biosynthesis ATPase subunit
MKLDAYLDLVDQCGYSVYPGFVSRSKNGRNYARLRQAHFRKIYAASENLDDIYVTGYINDNYGPFGNTSDKKKTSFVALAMADGDNNGAVIFSGCEQMYPSSIVLDWGGCLVASLGINTTHHHKAMAFYDEYMEGILGERNILGHSKGGNLATFVYINRLHQNTRAYCVNAQPYCWYIMDESQKEALKTERFEYIVHMDDPTRKASYVSYISRTAPLNRYAARKFINIHGFVEVNFDEFGNLEGTRVIRETKSELQSYLFKDYAVEKRMTHEECMARFLEKLAATTSLPRLFSTTLDEILMVTEAQGAIIWLKDMDEQGEFIYPLLIKSPGAEDLYQLKLREGQGIAAKCVFDGLPLFIRDSQRYQLPLAGINRMMGVSITSEIAVPLGIDENEVFGALELFNKNNDIFALDDFSLVNEMTLAMLEAFKESGQALDTVRDFSLVQLRQSGKQLFAVEKNSYQEMLFESVADQFRFLRKITGLDLEPNERLIFNRKTFRNNMTEQLKRLRKQEYAIIFKNPSLRNSPTTVKRVLFSLLLQSRESRINLGRIARMMGLDTKLKTSIRDLTDAEYIRLEYGMARLKTPLLVIVDTPPEGLKKSTVVALRNRLKKDCEKKLLTVVELRLNQPT